MTGRGRLAEDRMRSRQRFSLASAIIVIGVCFLLIWSEDLLEEDAADVAAALLLAALLVVFFYVAGTSKFLRRALRRLFVRSPSPRLRRRQEKRGARR